jgi:hypothetical protein
MVKVERQSQGRRSQRRTNVRGEVAGGAYHVLTYVSQIRAVHTTWDPILKIEGFRFCQTLVWTLLKWLDKLYRRSNAIAVSNSCWASLGVSSCRAKHQQNRDGCRQSFSARPEDYDFFSDSLTDSCCRQHETSHAYIYFYAENYAGRQAPRCLTLGQLDLTSCSFHPDLFMYVQQVQSQGRVGINVRLWFSL